MLAKNKNDAVFNLMRPPLCRECLLESCTNYAVQESSCNTQHCCDYDNNWKHYEPSGACYKWDPERRSQMDARENCNEWGGELVSIHSAEENEFVMNGKLLFQSIL